SAPSASRWGCRPELRPRLEHEIERRFGRAPEAGEPRPGRDLAEAPVTGLRAEAVPDLLRERVRRADERRHRVEEPADRVQVVLDLVVREGLDQHPRPVAMERAAEMAGGADGIAHVVETIEERHEIVVAPGEARR